MNAITGLPMPAVQLTLTSAEGNGQPGSLGTQSNGEGLFRFEGLQPGRYRLDATRAGFLPTKYGSPRYAYPGAILTLSQSQVQRDLVIRMTPQAIVTGRILDENRDPLVDAQVRIVQTGGNPTGSIAATNDLGEYRIFQIPPGKYYVIATPGLISRLPAVQATTTEDPKRVRVYVPTFHPGVADPLMAIPIELTAGSEVRVPDFALQKVDAVNIRGRVVQTVSRESAVINVRLSRRNARIVTPTAAAGWNTTATEEGRFELRGVAPGSYVISASLRSGGSSHSAQASVDVGSGGIEDLMLAIMPPVSMTGRIRLDTDSPSVLPSIVLKLSPVNALDLLAAFELAAKQSFEFTGKEGQFQIHNVNPGRHLLQFLGLSETYYVKSVRLGETDAFSAGIDVTSGQTAPLDVLISPRAAYIAGRVLDHDQAAAGAFVVVIPTEKERQGNRAYYRTGSTDQRGEFRIGGLAPGKYKVLAWEAISPSEYLDSGIVAAVDSMGESVTVSEGDTVKVSLKVIKPATP